MAKEFFQPSGADAVKIGGWKKWAILAGVAVFFIIFSPVTCVGKTERGVKVTLGAVQDGVYQPGPVFHWPIIEEVKTFSTVPNKIEVEIPVDKNGAITTDNQTVGTTFDVYWQYDQARICEIARNYSGSGVADLINTNTKSAIKAVIGTYTIFDLAPKQTEATGKIAGMLIENTAKYPVKIVDVKAINYDWSDEFDKAIATTQKLKQEVLQKEQEVSKATLDYQKQVAEAEAQKKVTIANAEAQKEAAIAESQGELESAKLKRDAKIAEGEGIRKYNDLVAVNWGIELKKLELEIEMARVTKWDGHYVPAQNFTPLPLNIKAGVQGD